MTLLFFDGMDGYGVEQDMGRRSGWAIIDNLSTYRTSSGKYGGGCLDTFGSAGEESDPINTANIYLSSMQTGFIFFGSWIQKVGAGSTTVAFWRLLDSATGTFQVTLRRNGNNIELWRGVSSSLLATSSGITFAEDTWYWLEIKAKIANSGSLELRLNGVTGINFSGDTQNGSNAGADQVSLYSFSNSSPPPACRWDDIIIWSDTAGDNFNTWIGEKRISVGRPYADGTTQQWTAWNHSSVHYDKVDETGLTNEDVDYVYSNTAAQKEFYLISPEVRPRTVYAAQVVTAARRDNPGTNGLKHRLKTAAGNEVAGSKQTVNIGYFHQKTMFQTDPDTSGSITTDILNGEMGVETA